MTAEPVDLVVCVDNSGYEAALERRKLYALLPDVEAETRGLLRVITARCVSTTVPPSPCSRFSSGRSVVSTTT